MTGARFNDKKMAELVQRYRAAGDTQAREEIASALRPLVFSIARRFAGREPLEDLQGEGYVGLLRAIDRFVPERGVRFSTFATHLIAGHIRHYLRDRGHLIRQPAWLQEVTSRVDKATVELEQRLQREPTVMEIAEKTNLSEETIEELWQARRTAQVARLRCGMDDEEGEFLEVDLERVRSRDYMTFELPLEDRIAVEEALEKLKEIERKVLYSFFYQEFNQSEIARRLGISGNYTGYVLRNGLKHLREGILGEAPARSTTRTTDAGSVVQDSTGLYTAGYFKDRLTEEISRAHRSENQVSVCCAELPRSLPDTQVRAAAELLRSEMRPANVPARTDDREFAVLFQHQGPISESLTGRLATLLNGAVPGRISVGMASYPRGAASAPALLAAARAAAGPMR